MMSNAIYDYYQRIEDGSVTVGHWIRDWYRLVVQRIEDKSYRFDERKANRAIRFVENFCRHHEGPLAPGLIQLELWQKAFLSIIFGIVTEDGYRQFREVVLIIGRKNGKTLLAAAIAAYMAYMDGEYGGRVYFTAPKLEQASLCYDAFFQMVQKEPELADLAKKRRTDIYIEQSNTTAKPLAFSAKKSDGLNISLGICDEIASWGGDQGLKFYEVLQSSQGARKQPLLLSISTAGYLNDGVYDELYKRSTSVLKGTSKETRLAPFIYQIDDEDNWSSIAEMQKANPNLGVSVSVDYLLEQIRIAESSLPKRAEVLTKHCNIKQNSSQAWLDYSTVERCLSQPLNLAEWKDCYCVGGIDLSQSTDLTSACVVLERDGKLNVLSHFWLPASRIDEATERDGVPYNAMIARGFLSLSGDNYIDYEDCFRWFVELVERYSIYPLQIGYDKYCATFLITKLKEYGFHCDDVFQGTNLTPVIREFEGLVKDGVVRIGENGLLMSHLLNTALKSDHDSQRVQMVKIAKASHIDGAAALIDAMTVRQKWWPEIGAQLQNRR